jgi:single-strand DNA-binding protein
MATQNDPGTEHSRQQQAEGVHRYEELGEVTLSGNICTEVTTAFTPGGKQLTQFRLAVNGRMQDPSTGQWHDTETEYHDILTFGRLAAQALECLAGGYRVIVHGRRQRDTYTDPNGKKTTRVNVVARDIGASILYAQVRVYKRNAGKVNP